MANLELLEETHWRDRAACRGAVSDVFFPTSEDVGLISAAKEMCAACPVQETCLSYAVETNQTEGIWGGLTARQRRRIRRTWLEEQRQAS
ncbi:MAG: WhiB family transcriptional regulator [Acidimicrobiia bacterium]|nr:WhiB family transcriptional regulator [Acidimicrobiia bacterium]MDH3470060.1 WhiB family transcriptional regulator [Acidimicrobiia bacterium]